MTYEQARDICNQSMENRKFKIDSEEWSMIYDILVRNNDKLSDYAKSMVRRAKSYEEYDNDML